MTRTLLTAIFLTLLSQTAWGQTVTIFCKEETGRLGSSYFTFIEPSKTASLAFTDTLVPYEENSRFRMGSKTVDFDSGATIHWFVYDKFNYRLVTKQIHTKVSKNSTVVEYRQRWDCTDE